MGVGLPSILKFKNGQWFTNLYLKMHAFRLKQTHFMLTNNAKRL